MGIAAMTDKGELAQRRKKLCDDLAAAQANAAPLPIEDAMQELGRCLTLCAPSGMTQGDRIEWLTVALGEVGDVPASVFEAACTVARRTCDHPAKIVPTLIRESEGSARHRLNMVSYAQAKLDNLDAPKLAPPAPENRDYVGAQEMGELVKKLAANVVQA